MRRALVLLTLAAIAAATTAVVQRVDRDRAYQRQLADGDRALASRNGSSAIEAFSGAIALRPSSMIAYYRRGEAYRLEHQDVEAIRDLREASRLAPDATPPLVALGELADEHGDAGQAAVWYGMAADVLKGEDPSLLYALALARYRAGSPSAAIAPLQQVIARRDSTGEGRYLLALAYRDTGNPNEAIAALEDALKIAPGLMPAREELASLFHSTGRQQEEVAELEAIAALDHRVERRLAVALAMADAGTFDQALAELNASDRTAPLVIETRGRILLAKAERTLNRVDAAHAVVALSAALSTPTRSEVLARLGRAKFLADDFTSAYQVLRSATTTDPVAPDAFAYLADVAERLGRPREALDALLTLDLLQGDAMVAATRNTRQRRIGVLALSVNQPARAAEVFTQVVNRGMADAETLGLLAQARWRAGDATGAVESLTRALASDPHDPELLRLARTIK